MSSVLSIPDVVDSTIKNALKKSAAPAGTNAASGKMRGVFEYAKSHTFTLIGVIAVALVVAVGVYMAMQHYRKKKKALNTDEEALANNEFEDAEEAGEADEAGEAEPYEAEEAGEADEADDEEMARRGPKSGPRGQPKSERAEDPNWTPLELLTPDG